MNERDETIDRVSRQLRELPEVNPDAKARVLIAVAAQRQRDHDASVRRVTVTRQLRWLGGGALAAAALFAVVLVRTGLRAAPAVVAASSSPPAPILTPTAQLAASDPAALEMAPQPVQFVFRAPDATTVNVVGDFNTWEKAPMVRDSASGIWSATLMVRPGRHVYAFVVNDSLWRRDPRAAAAPDVDFGRPGSVLLVGRPALPESR